MEEELKQAFTACGYDEKFAKAVLSNRPDLCEYQCNGAMAAAKAYKKKPIDIAAEVAEKLSDSRIFSMKEAVMPGFLNLKISEEFAAEYLNKMRLRTRRQLWWTMAERMWQSPFMWGICVLRLLASPLKEWAGFWGIKPLETSI